MRKVFIWFCLFFLCACQSSSYDPQQSFEPYTISVYVPNETYAKALLELWEIRYPNRKDALQFVDQIKADIVFVKDQDALDAKTEALVLEDFEIEVAINERLQHPSLQNIYVPIQGEGFIFAYNRHMLEKYQMNERDLDAFETLAKNGANIYYHNHTFPYVYPFLLRDYREVEEETLDEYSIQGDLKVALKQYAQLYETLNLSDNMLDQQTFYQSYVCGLYDLAKLDMQQDFYTEGLHFTKMPSWLGKPLRPAVTTYGFMAYKATKSPFLVKAFLEMTRSKEGIQAFLDSTSGIALIQDKDIDDFYIYSRSKKEIIQAMNESQLHLTGDISDRLQQGDFTSIVQNYIKSKREVEAVYKDIMLDFS